MNNLIDDILNHPAASLAVVGNLVMVESLLSVDNAAVLATMVMDLPREERKKALRYGILGAYIFRGLSLFVVAILVQIWWLKVVGGLYLIYLVVNWWVKRNETGEGGDVNEIRGPLFRAASARVGKFWATVISVELMDMAFSLDNVFAAVAFSPNILLILTGVFIGILAMRFVAQGFVKLMEKYQFLEVCAYIVIGLLGLKMVLSVVGHFKPDSRFALALESSLADWLTSGFTIAIFVIPLLSCAFFGVPHKRNT